MENGSSKGAEWRDESIVIGPGEGHSIGRGGQAMEIKVGSEQTGGTFSFLTSTLQPGSGGPPLHMHSREDEALYVVEGALLLQLGERRVKATAGCFVYMPRGSAHTFCNPFQQIARVIGVLTPAGFEPYFQEFDDYMSSLAGNKPDLATLSAMGAKYGGTIVGPPMRVEAEVPAHQS